MLREVEMITNESILSVVAFAILVAGLCTKRFGTFSIVVMIALLINICTFPQNTPVPYGCFIAIAVFVFLIVLHGKKYGKKTPLYQYNPYNPNSKLPFKVKLVLLIIAVIVLTTTLLSRIHVIK